MRYFSRRAVGALTAAVLSLSACASTQTASDPDDPYESWNRKAHGFNVALDRNVMRPAAQGYDIVTPGLFQLLIGNFIDYLKTPGDFVNDVLQGEVDQALNAFGRITINTVVGIGVLDPATDFGLPRKPNDFGITLAKAGVDSGPFLMLPLLGPSNPRDLAGSFVDMAFSPPTYVGVFTDISAFGPGLRVVELLDTRAKNAAFIDEALYNSPDSYTTLKTVFQQRRRAAIGGDAATEGELPIIFDDELDAITE